jgi:hypothetical protein
VFHWIREETKKQKTDTCIFQTKMLNWSIEL